MTGFKASFYYAMLVLLPKDYLSWLIGKLVSLPLPRAIACMVNRAFASAFKIDLSEAELPLDHYGNLQEFFIRRLKSGIRPITTDAGVLVSPCDGKLSVGTKADHDTLMQVKGKNYRLADFLKDAHVAKRFVGGHYATLYLSPRDYHRFHSPIDGEIISTSYVPGSLWPVNNWAVHTVDQLFCRNERVVILMKERSTQKILAYIAVGATVVGKIKLCYSDFDQYDKGDGEPRSIAHQPIEIKKGQEIGRFMFGSTIVLLMEPGLMTSFTKVAPAHVKMGETLGNLQQELV